MAHWRGLTHEAKNRIQKSYSKSCVSALHLDYFCLQSVLRSLTTQTVQELSTYLCLSGDFQGVKDDPSTIVRVLCILRIFSLLQVTIKSYLKNLLYQPRQLLSEFQQLDQQQFQTAMKCLFNSRTDHLVSRFALVKNKSCCQWFR